MRVFPVAASPPWAEGTVNWNNKPALGTPELGSAAVPTLNAYNEITLSPSAVSGNGAVKLRADHQQHQQRHLQQLRGRRRAPAGRDLQLRAIREAVDAVHALSRTRWSEPLGMGTLQGIEGTILSVGILAAVAYIATMVVRRPTDHPLLRLLVALVPAVIAVAFVVFNRVDVVPDDVEQGAWGAGVVVITVILIVGTTWRVARR